MAHPNSALATAFLVLVLMPQMVVSGKFPRIPLSPRTKKPKPLKEFFKEHFTDLPDLFDVGSYSDQTQPDIAPPSGGRSQAAATNAGKYIFSFQVGTPPQPVSGALDITGELVWLRCDCDGPDDCGGAAGGGGAAFNSSLSSTMAEAPCTSNRCQSFVPQECDDADTPRCSYAYANRHGNTTGYLAAEAFQLDDDEDPVQVVFGCSFFSEGDFGGVSGEIGLGRGPLSLVSQLGVGRFSYYLAPDDSDSDSFLHFGDDDAATPKSKPLSAPLLANPYKYPSFYYVGLTGVQVDGQDLPIPAGTFDLAADGSGGVILSLTVPITYLDKGAYQLLRKALASKIGQPTVDGSALGLDLCYTNESLATAKVPAVALAFDGGTVMQLETWNYFYSDADTGLECLTIRPSRAGGGSVLGNLIQAGTHMIYDVSGSKLLFESLHKESDSPQGPPSSSSQKESNSSQGSSSPTILSALPLNFVCVVLFMLYYLAAAF